MKKYLKYVIIALLLISAAIVFIQLRKSSNRPEWKIDSPSKGTIREVVTATGSLNPTVLVEVGTEVSGTIKTLYKDFNDKVRKGEVLARLDTEILAASVESAQAEVNKARVSRDEASMEYNNSETLFSRDMISSYELQKDKYSLDQAKLNLATALLRLQTAEKNLKNATITSPIDGVIVSREVSEGQTVAASMNSPTLFTIANNLDQMEITASVDEADIGKISVGLPVEFSVDAHAGQMFTGSVQQIRLKSETEQNVVSYSVIIDAANPDHKLLPGMTTNVTIITQSKENVIRIPETATRFTPSKEVWELFGLKWEDDLIPNARKAAMEKAIASASGGRAPSRDNPRPDSAKAPSGRPPRGFPGGMPPGGMPGGVNRGGGNGRNGGSALIWVLKDKTPELIMVRTGVSDGAFVEVLSPLDPDTKIITGVNYKDPSQAKVNSALQQGRPGMGPRF
ncbi:MAG TPA: efflux RND transporter periplasmic adaptor subunit [Candidatus Syntrophosphaera sp.]|nr:efflux RND transporter periplasmic adaptor subunit [Candidatus Syntrophosphaera sp.]